MPYREKNVKSGRLATGDIFWYNHYNIDRKKHRICALGKQHLHYINIEKYECAQIVLNDGDYPLTDDEDDTFPDDQKLAISASKDI